MSSTLGAALFYATEKGWPVIPVWPVKTIDGRIECRCGSSKCRSVGKHPVTKIGNVSIVSKGVLDATTNTKQIRKWWKLLPDANIGVRGDKFFALDVDEEDALFSLESEYAKLPDTVESFSGSGGRHILFKQPTGLVFGNEEGDLPNGINVRGNRGYIIVAPSIHVSGNRYEWELSSHPRDVELAEAPEWLIKLIGKPIKKTIGQIECSDDIPELEGLDMHSSIKTLIMQGVPDGDDRSSADQRVIVALLSAGCEPEEVKGIFNKYPIGTQGKYAERGDVYLNRSIARAVLYVGKVDKKRGSVEELHNEEELGGKKKASKIVPGKRITTSEARMEELALDAAYLRGWNDALAGNTEIVDKLWPNRLGLTSSAINWYNLGMRIDMSVDETEREFPALVIPYSNGGKVANVGYELSNQPFGIPASMWEAARATHVFDTDLEGSSLTGQALITEDWDTAMYTYLNHGHAFSWLSMLGLPNITGYDDEEVKKAHLYVLANLLADSERVLLAWPASRRKDASQLASMLERGNERVYWITMPGTMRQMYKQFGLNAKYLNRYIQQATPIQ